MSILSDFEDRLAGAVDGVFAGVFRSPVQPVEIAKALGSTMDDRRSVGVSRVYAPTHYTVSISPADADEMGTFRDTLSGELSTYVVARAQEKQYHLASKPAVSFVVDDRLKLGRFKVGAEMAAPAAPQTAAAAPAPEAAPAAPTPSSARDDLASRLPEVVPSSSEPATTVEPSLPVAEEQAADIADSGIHMMATVTVTGIDHDVALKGERVVIGRLEQCDICLQDANVSREHAAFMAEGSGWAIKDLDSTNGSMLNGAPVTYMRLADGDVIQLGVSELIYHEPRV